MSGSTHRAAPFVLAERPDWHGAASELVDALSTFGDTERRVLVLEEVCTGLGDALYPAFLQVLHAIERDGDVLARRSVARTLVDSLLSGRLPSGRLPAWGASRLSPGSPFGQVRTLGPIEYVCAWHAQPSGLPTLTDERFDTVVTGLLSLVATHPPAAELYARKLLSDAEDPLGGSLGSATRQGLGELARCWRDGASPVAASAAFRRAVADGNPAEALARVARPAALV